MNITRLQGAFKISENWTWMTKKAPAILCANATNTVALFHVMQNKPCNEKRQAGISLNNNEQNKKLR